ncbi:histidinol-phosphate transaminase [Agromyces sp. NPDC058136]|uniref:histidinol-phosphate transaminase n=1 Tax=Agromyces sp. NPDC058136 TaxID=3346354 RepID=UPI0036DEF151
MIHQRDVIGRLPVYKPGRPAAQGAVKLSSNENPFPPLPSVVAAVAAGLESIQRYPDLGAAELTLRLAEHYDVDPGEIALGAGSVEVASQLIHASAGDGDEVVFAWRSFEAYPILVQVAGATPVPVPLTADERHDLGAMADAITPRTRLVFVCNPNNPTGATVTAEELTAFLAKVPAEVLVVIDEAYVHFDDDPRSANGLEFFRSHPNVAVLHTFSKAYGLAGLRVGYAIAPAAIAANLRRVAVPFAVSDLGQRAAIASLDAESELEVRIREIVAERARVTAGLRETGWQLVDSFGNFVWLRTGEETERVEGVLQAHGVVARAFAGEGIRVTIGSPEANDRFLAAAAEAHAGAAAPAPVG